MSSHSGFLFKDACAVFPFDAYGSSNRFREEAFFSAMNGLRTGEILRLFIDRNPLRLIRKIVLKFGSKLMFQYLHNRDGSVIIDFQKMHD